jgi:hypothetical protein
MDMNIIGRTHQIITIPYCCFYSTIQRWMQLLLFQRLKHQHIVIVLEMKGLGFIPYIMMHTSQLTKLCYNLT